MKINNPNVLVIQKLREKMLTEKWLKFFKENNISPNSFTVNKTI